MYANSGLHNAVLIHQLPKHLLKTGMLALAESISIPVESVTPYKLDHWGVNLILDTDSNFKKIVLKGFLEVSNKMYLVYPAVTDLALRGASSDFNEAMVKHLLKPFAPVLLVYPEKNNSNGTLARNYRATLFHPEIPEEVKKWTCIKLKSSPIDNTELSITSFCRFCRQYDHTRHECNIMKLQNSSNVAAQDSSVTSSSNIKRHVKLCTSPESSSLLNSFPEIFRNPKTDQNENQVSHQISKTEFRIPEQAAEFSRPFNFIKLIPPSLKKDIIHLKKFFLDDDILEKPYHAALHYPEGINKLLIVLEYMGRFNEKYIEKRLEEEKKFIKWLHLMTAKIKYLHLLNISKIEPQYKLPLEEIRKVQIENINTNSEHQGIEIDEHCTKEKNPINSQTKTLNKSSKTFETYNSRIGHQSEDKNENSVGIIKHKPVLSKINRKPSRENNFHISGFCNSKNPKSFCQTENGNSAKCSTAMEKHYREVATKKTQPQTITQNKPFVAEPEMNLMDDIINNIYLTHNKNARQTELSAQNWNIFSPVQKNSNFIHKDQHTMPLTNEKMNPQIIESKQNFYSNPTDGFSSPNPKSESSFMAKNFPVTVKREPNESFSENTIFHTSDAMLNGILKKKIKTEFKEEEAGKKIKEHSSDAMLNGLLKKKIKTEYNEEEAEKEIKEHHEATLADEKSNVLPKADCKSGITDTLKRKSTHFTFSNGLNSAINHSEGILPPATLKAFFTHVRGKKYPWKYAAIYEKDVSKIIEQLEVIVYNYYHGTKRSKSDDAQISWMMQLIKKLKEH